MDEPRTRAVFRDKVYECLALAEHLYDIDFGRVAVMFDLKGTTAAYAVKKSFPDKPDIFKLRFNEYAVKHYWTSMVKSTIPHEVAHLVAMAAPDLAAENHNAEWQRIAIMLGDINRGETCHNFDLPPARRTVKYVYRLGGVEARVGPNLHRKVQSGQCAIIAQGVTYTASDYSFSERP